MGRELRKKVCVMYVSISCARARMHTAYTAVEEHSSGVFFLFFFFHDVQGRNIMQSHRCAQQTPHQGPRG